MEEYKVMTEMLRLFEEKHKDVIESYRNRIENGDIQTNINELLDAIRSKTKIEPETNQKFFLFIYNWTLYRYGIRDNFKIWRGYLMHCLDNETNINISKNINNSLNSLNRFVTGHGIENIHDLSIKHLEFEEEDLLSLGEIKKSTKLFKNSIEKLNIQDTRTIPGDPETRANVDHVFNKDLYSELQIFYLNTNGKMFESNDLDNFYKCFSIKQIPDLKLNFTIGAVQDFGYFIRKLEEIICKDSIDSYNEWVSERFQFKGKDLSKELVASYKTGKQERTVSKQTVINQALEIIYPQNIHPKISIKTSL